MRITIACTTRSAALAILVAIATTASAGAQICEPNCRTGYTCLRGTCVSACNPPCDADEFCTEQAACEWKSARRAPSQRASAIPVRSFQWFLSGGAGYALSSVYTSHDKEVGAGTAAVRVGIGLRQPLTSLLELREELVLLAGTDFGIESVTSALLEGTLRIGPVARAFPWWGGVGPTLGVMAMQGHYPQEDEKHGATAALVGGRAETGFAIANVDVGVEARVAIQPADQLSGIMYGGVFVALGI